jgi:A/G-specific adenine glycosylase
MDYGATMHAAGAAIKEANPNRRSVLYKRQTAFAGSDRELRGKIMRSTLARKGNKMSAKALQKVLAISRERFDGVIKGLTREGFIVRKGNYICIK